MVLRYVLRCDVLTGAIPGLITIDQVKNAAAAVKERRQFDVAKAVGPRGHLVVPLAEYKRTPGGKILLTPHTLAVTKDGRTTTREVTVDKAKTVTAGPTAAGWPRHVSLDG